MTKIKIPKIPVVKIQNQAKRITVKPRTKIIKIGGKRVEVGYHYMRDL